MPFSVVWPANMHDHCVTFERRLRFRVSSLNHQVVPLLRFARQQVNFVGGRVETSSLKNNKKLLHILCITYREGKQFRQRTDDFFGKRRRRRLLFNWRTECRSLKAKETKPWHQRPTNQTISSFFSLPFSLCAGWVHELFRVLTSSFSCNWSVLRHPVGAEGVVLCVEWATNRHGGRSFFFFFFQGAIGALLLNY